MNEIGAFVTVYTQKPRSNLKKLKERECSHLYCHDGAGGPVNVFLDDTVRAATQHLLHDEVAGIDLDRFVSECD